MVKSFPPNTGTEFVDLVCAGMSADSTAARLGTSSASALRWWAHSGGMKIVTGRIGGLADPVPEALLVSERKLTASARGIIQMGRRAGIATLRSVRRSVKISRLSGRR